MSSLHYTCLLHPMYQGCWVEVQQGFSTITHTHTHTHIRTRKCCHPPCCLLHAAVAVLPQQQTNTRPSRQSRDLIYAALLRSMSPEHKFNSAAKLSGEVLAGVADGLLPLSECEEVLRDALCLMASKEIKVQTVYCTGIPVRVCVYVCACNFTG